MYSIWEAAENVRVAGYNYENSENKLHQPTSHNKATDVYTGTLDLTVPGKLYHYVVEFDLRYSYLMHSRGTSI